MARLSNNEAQSGWTDYITIDHSHADFVASTTDDADVIIQYPLKAGEALVAVGWRLDADFNDSGGGDELTLMIGDASSDPDGYITDKEIHTDGTEITYAFSDGALLDNENGVLKTADDNIDLKFSPNTATGQSYALSELTAGKITVFFHIKRLTNLQ